MFHKACGSLFHMQTQTHCTSTYSLSLVERGKSFLILLRYFALKSYFSAKNSLPKGHWIRTCVFNLDWKSALKLFLSR